MSFTGYACWERDDASTLLATEALEGSRSFFLATHHPLPEFEVRGSRAALVEERNELGLLAMLTRPTNRHVFCVVEGEPGSGKSHLIRWLNVKWPNADKRDLVLLIQRADGSLEGTLNSLKERLPEAYRPIFGGVARSAGVATAGRRLDFLAKLANSMGRDYFEQPLPDAKWCADRDIKAVLSHAKVGELWGAPSRILDIISGKGSSGAARDQELAQFTISDVVGIAQMEHALRGLPFAAVSWIRKLRKEAEALVPEERSGQIAVSPDKFPETTAFLSALDRRLNNAIQELLGTTARELDELFKKLRQQLHSEGRRLVLLLEDVTNWQGVDEKLIDALVFNADTREDNLYCDLISVLGVTPDYFRRYIETKKNYADRMTLHLVLPSGAASSLEGFEVPFSARYLRAIRAGREKLSKFDDRTDVFNRCATCQHRQACHGAFGEHQGIGLYPFTARALRTMFASLEDATNGAIQKTPRGLIQNILNPSLLRPDALEKLAYPHAALQTSFLRMTDMDPAVRILIEQEEPGHHEALKLLLSWWGEATQLEAQGHDEQGNPVFQGVPRGVFEAFGLPWLGNTGASVDKSVAKNIDENASKSSTREAEISVDRKTVPDAESREPQPDELDEPKAPKEKPQKKAKDAEEPRGTKKSSDSWELTKAQLSARREQLKDWFDNKPLLEGETFWNKWLYRLVIREVAWRRLGISPWLQATLFTDSTVMLEGTKKTGSNFVLPRAQWVRDGLEAYITLQTRPFLGTDFHRYQLARMVRKIEEEVVAYIGRAKLLVEGKDWSPVGILVQVALARAWLRGTLLPGQPLVDQWEYLFRPEAEASGAPKKRVEAWEKLSNRTHSFPGEFEKRIPHMVNQPQGTVTPGAYGACELGLADPSEAIPAMRTLIGQLEFSAHPPAQALKFDHFLSTVLEMVDSMATLSDLPQREGKRLLTVGAELEEASPKESLKEHAERVQRVVEQIADARVGAPNDAIQGWTQRYSSAIKPGAGFLEPGARARLERLDRFKSEASTKKLEDFATQKDLLDWCIQSPVEDAIDARDLVKQGETSLKRIVEYADEIFAAAAAAGGATLDEVRQAGVALSNICTTLTGAIKERK